MVKYSIELKQRIIQDYLSGKGGSTYLAKLHNVGSSSQVRHWIRNYRAEGLPTAHSKVN
ncbi:helix-turn-helix domain-containing protein, partial [Lactococcus lactis]